MGAGAGGVTMGRVLVTGASRGIGRAVVVALAARGTAVAAAARDREALEVLRGLGDVHPVWADLAVADDRDSLVERAATRLGGLDGLVCAAGIARHARVGAIEPADLDAQLTVNLLAPVLLAQAAAPHMRAAGRGSIVALSSTLASRAAPATVGYAASKGGLEAAVRGLALELAPDGIRVNAVAPGVVDTDMVRALRLEPGEPEPIGEALRERVDAQLEVLRRLHPVGRLGTPEEVAAVVLHVLDSPYTTGSVVTVDGGLTLGG